jgi:hypothetical protein
MSCDLVMTDRFGKEVRLDHNNWQRHEQRRPEIGPHHDQAPLILGDPDVVMEDPRDGHYLFYRRGFPIGRFNDAYFCVVVEYFDGGAWGAVKTCWLTTTIISRGVPRWIRPRRS